VTEWRAKHPLSELEAEVTRLRESQAQKKKKSKKQSADNKKKRKKRRRRISIIQR